jgi:hypothetical protein
MEKTEVKLGFFFIFGFFQGYTTVQDENTFSQSSHSFA